jgi:hypothetical protein
MRQAVVAEPDTDRAVLHELAWSRAENPLTGV